MRKSGGEPMSCGYSPTPPAACAWSAHSPSKPTKTGSKPTATSIWTHCASRRKPNYAKPHDQLIGRAHVSTPVTNAHLVFRLLLATKTLLADFYTPHNPHLILPTLYIRSHPFCPPVPN